MMLKQNIEAIDLFCGIGSLSYGLKQAGITVKAGLDLDASCRYAYEKNVRADFIEADIGNYDLLQLKKYYSKKSIKVLVGCAPCQPFSTHLHKNQNKKSDGRWNLIKHFTKAVKVLEPDIISMENVRGLKNTDVFKDFIKELELLNYHIKYEIVFCPDYGIPQNRYRLVLLAGLNKQIPIPSKTHTRSQYKTVFDAIGKLAPLKSNEICKSDPIHRTRKMMPINLERIRQSKPAGTWHDWEKRLLPNCYKKDSGKTYTSVYGRMSWDKPAPTITTQFFCYGSGRFGHPDQDRALSVREGAILQTFPKDYDFGEIKSMQALGRHIGNAVPSRLGQVIGETIVKFL